MRFGKYRFNIYVSNKNPHYWLRPASKASTLGAYILGFIALLLHFF